MSWTPVNPPLYGIVKMDFNPPPEWLASETRVFLRHLKIGSGLRVLEETLDWYRVFCFDGNLDENAEATCIVPKSFVHLTVNSLGNSTLNSTASSRHSIDENHVEKTDEHETGKEKEQGHHMPVGSLGEIHGDSLAGQSHPIIDIVAAALTEWSDCLDRLLTEKNYTLHSVVYSLFRQMDQHRTILLSNTLSDSEAQMCRERLWTKLNSGNKMLGLPLVLPNDEKTDYAHLGKSTVLQIQEMYMAELDPIQAPSKLIDEKDLFKLSRVDLYFGFKAAVSSLCEVDESLEIHFSILDKKSLLPVTENFVVQLNHHGTALDVSRFGKLTCIFQGLSIKNSHSQELYLVGRITRVRFNVHRPFGFAILALSEVLNESIATVPICKEFVIPLLACPNEADFGSLHVLKHLDELVPFPKMESMTVSLASLEPGSGFVTSRTGFLKEVTMTPRFGLDESELPIQRNSFYICLEESSFANVKKPIVKNILVTAQLRRSNGDFVENCFYQGSGIPLQSTFSSVLYLNYPSPIWNQTIRMDVDPVVFMDSHLVMLFQNVSVPWTNVESLEPFAFAFLPLVRDASTVLSDGQHSLNVYKFDANVVAESLYLNYPAGPSIFVPAQLRSSSIESLSRAAELMSKIPVLTNECILSTHLSSTFLTQEYALCKMIRWKDVVTQNRGDLSVLLHDFSLLGEVEMIKFAPQVLGSLLQIFAEMGDPHAVMRERVLPVKAQAFDSLVLLFNLVSDRRFQAHRQSVESFLETQITSPTLGATLCNHICLLMDNADDPDVGKFLRKTVKVWNYLFKIVIQSCIVASKDQLYARETMRAFVLSLSRMLALTTPEHVLACQSLALQNLMPVMELMTIVFPVSECCDLVFQKLLSCATKPKLHAGRLALLKQVWSRPVFQACPFLLTKWTLPFLSSALLNVTDDGSVVSEHVRDPDVKKQAIGLFLDMVQYLGKVQQDQDENITFVADLFVILVTFARYLFMSEVFADIEKISTAFLGFLICFEEGQVKSILDSLLLRNGFKETLKSFLNCLDLFKRIMNLNVYEGKLVLQSALNTQTLIYLECILSVLNLHTCPPLREMSSDITLDNEPRASLIKSDPETAEKAQLLDKLWSTYLLVTTLVLESPSTRIETFGPQQSRLLHKLNADVRARASLLLYDGCIHFQMILANVVGSVLYPMAIIDKLLVLTSSDHDITACIAADIMFECIKVEVGKEGHFKRIESIVFDSLDEVTPSSFDLNQFVPLFEARIELFGSDAIGQQGRQFIKSLKKLSKLLSQFANAPKEDVDEQVVSIQRLLKFFKLAKRHGLFVKYVHQLYDLHLTHQSFIEAALVLKQHGDILDWANENILEPLPELGFTESQTEFDRKLAIYLNCIQLLDRGQAWERCVDLCHEVSLQIKLKSWDYHHLSNILRSEAALYDRIMTEERVFCLYYKVGFYGLDFDKSTRGKQYIYRAETSEKIADFADRMQRIHPDAKLIMKGGSVDKAVVEGQGKWIQIATVGPIADLRHWKPLLLRNEKGLFGLIHWQLEGVMNDVHVHENGDDTKDDTFPLWLAEPDLFGQGDADATAILSLAHSMPLNLRSYFENNEVAVFCQSRPFRKSTPSLNESNHPAKEFLELWTEKTLLFTEDSFPCLGRRSRIKRVMTFEISPIENAIIAIRKKTRQLIALEKKYGPEVQVEPITPEPERSPKNSWVPPSRWSIVGKYGTGGAARYSMASNNSDLSNSKSRSSSPVTRESMMIPSRPVSTLPHANINPFTMALNGAIDAPVNGGIPMYKLAFLSESTPVCPPALQRTLESAISEQIQVIYRCLMVHGTIVPAQMRPLHDELVKAFHKNYAQELVHD